MPLSIEHLFPSSFAVNDYVKKTNLPHLFGAQFDPARDYQTISVQNETNTVNPEYTSAFQEEYSDLSRLHFLIISRKVFTVLEFGIGKSSMVFADALHKNYLQSSDKLNQSIRRLDKYKAFCVDSSEHWINQFKKEVPHTLVDRLSLHFSEVYVDQYQGKICTYYKNMPNVSPDLIYLDAPDQFHVQGDVRGITTAHQDRMPMAADILTIEHFLNPGTLIVIDGRTANARFLQCNLQRNWAYLHDYSSDQHYFELQESPLGKHNKNLIDFCLGDQFYSRL